MDDCNPCDPLKLHLSIEGLPWALKPPVEGEDCREAKPDDFRECCEPSLLDVQLGYESLPPAEAVRTDLSCDYSPLKLDERPQSLDFDRIDQLPLDRRG